ncbi:uncharacterized protein TRAVEDRAFT_50029 [Trametes versicolor FP-101664 SS1]|uniref:uncharacterized protein n=1 Tax=Trametes versicolor (strain FP-101664) TaxID=717944 RepID=UPI0004621A80|nr:uncharacterized protein TRAVEDRAFT_50029 [Trametes versicolor FP-101664 SS1]EIW55543.1 hypothetical protein TRAVEDRAFT_50029 [Trametes versicolor FP-101664 SS1]
MDLPEDEKANSSFAEDTQRTRLQRWFAPTSEYLAHWGIETNGIDPILPEDRTDTKLYQMFFVWFSANMNVLGFGTGSSGPAFFGLGLRDSFVILGIVDLISCVIPAYFAVFGPKLGMRSMVLARYSWGYFGSIIPGAFTVFSMQGFLILNCIIGGQTLASVSSHLDDTLGIIIIGVLSLIVTFFGYRVIHWYETVAWIPSVITFVVILGLGGKHLTQAPCDKLVHYDPRLWRVSHEQSLKLTSHLLGAAFAAAAPGVPSWEAGFDNGNNAGGLIQAVLAPSGGFGKFLTVLLALSVPSTCAPTLYTFASSFMAIHASFARVPRYVYIFISEAILIPVAIIGARHFYATFVDVMNVIGYWSIVFAAIVIAEHVVFRRNDWERYDLSQYCQPNGLPLGLAAILAFSCACEIIVPCMSQAWYVGPIANAGTGDIGIIVGFALAGMVYPAFRAIEIAFSGR